jgi:hypothetical protein
MTEDQQVRRLMSLIKDSVPLSIASAKAGMSEPTARKYRKAGQLPSQLKKKHDWRTRADPFREVWPEVQVLLERDDGLEAKTVFQEIERRYPNSFSSGQLRTLQRRLRDWRALHGPEQEVFFPQQYRPGEQSQSDFTEMNSVEVTIAGEPLRHLIYHFVLPYSNWEQVAIAYSENFEALSEGLQGALWKLGAVPRVHRTDNLSAATHELIRTQGRGFTERYLELLSHYGMKPSKNHPGNGHENGDVEQSHYRFRRAVDQRLRLRGSRDFATLGDYRQFLAELAQERNHGRTERFRQELLEMRPLPARRLEAFREQMVSVTRTSIVRLLSNAYSVPSRLIGYRLKARISAEWIELEYRGQVIERLERIRGRDKEKIDYRHLIGSLVRKPGAFRRFAYREALFPSLVFRKAYDVLVERSSRWADLEYLRILHLAATTLQCRVEQTLEQLLSEGQVPEYETVKSLATPLERIAWPEVRIAGPDLAAYDQLLSGGGLT